MGRRVLAAAACLLSACSGVGASLGDDPSGPSARDRGNQAVRGDADSGGTAIGDAGSGDNGNTDAAPSLDASCIPTSCVSIHVSCGAIDDGCGHTLNCGDCGSPPPLGCGSGAEGAGCGRFSGGYGHNYDCGQCSISSVCQITAPSSTWGYCKQLDDYRPGPTSDNCRPFSEYSGGGNYVYVALIGVYRLDDGGVGKHGDGEAIDYFCPQGTTVPPAGQCVMHNPDALNPNQYWVCNASPGY
jgi:hypothetical protein